MLLEVRIDRLIPHMHSIIQVGILLDLVQETRETFKTLTQSIIP